MMSTLPPRNQTLLDLTRAYHKEATDNVGPQCAALSELLNRGSAAFDRTHYTPGHVTASAFVLSPDQSAVLLILHRKLGLWLQPGGHVEPNDMDIATAARREVVEETGVAGLELLSSTLFDLDIHDIPAFGTTPEHQHFDVRFRFQASTATLQPSSEVADARWVPLAEVSDLKTDESVRRAVERLIQLQQT